MLRTKRAPLPCGSVQWHESETHLSTPLFFLPPLSLGLRCFIGQNRWPFGTIKHQKD